MQTIQSSSSPESAEQIRNFLQSQHSGVLATSDLAGNPHAAPVYFSLEEDYSLLFATKTETQKYKNIMENDKVAFVCYDEKTQTTAQISGKVKKVEKPDDKQAVLNTIYHLSETISGAELPPIEKLFAGEYVVLQIVPQVIKMATFLRPDSEGEDAFESLIFG